MADYIGNPCPVCGQVFKEGDDIVVCPDCGTPYHRACWQQVGHCVHEAEHAAGFVWQPAARPAAAEQVTCPHCGSANAAGARYCNQCGAPLPQPKPAAEQQPDETPVYARRPGQSGGEAPRMTAYTAGAGGIYRQEIGPDDPIDGIKARDWASYVGRSSPYYLMQFFRMSATRRRAGVCLSAFFLGPIYFLYRKMWREGVFFTILTLLLRLPNILGLLANAGVPLFAHLPLEMLAATSEVCYLLGWVLNMVMGLFAVYWYKQEAGRRIRAIYDRVPEGPDRADALALSGGTSLIAVVIYIAAYLLLVTALTAWVGPYLQTYLYNLML